MPLLMCPNCSEGMQEIRRNDVQIYVSTQVPAANSVASC
jgi:Zn-finger nucleic acid-binding protein